MLRLEIVRLFGAEKRSNWNASLCLSFSGTRRWKRKYWEKKDCLHLGHGKTSACWDEADFQSRSLQYGKRNLEFGVSVKSPAGSLVFLMVISVCWEELFQNIHVLFLIQCCSQEKEKNKCKIQIFPAATEDSPCPWSVPVRIESSNSLGVEWLVLWGWFLWELTVLSCSLGPSGWTHLGHPSLYQCISLLVFPTASTTANV